MINEFIVDYIICIKAIPPPPFHLLPGSLSCLWWPCYSRSDLSAHTIISRLHSHPGTPGPQTNVCVIVCSGWFPHRCYGQDKGSTIVSHQNKSLQRPLNRRSTTDPSWIQTWRVSVLGVFFGLEIQPSFHLNRTRWGRKLIVGWVTQIYLTQLLLY